MISCRKNIFDAGTENDLEIGAFNIENSFGILNSLKTTAIWFPKAILIKVTMRQIDSKQIVNIVCINEIVED